MALLYLYLACASALVFAMSSSSDPDPMLEVYEKWLAKYGRSKPNDVDGPDGATTRFEIFKSNVKRIESHNSDANQPFTLAINQFADLTTEEFAAKYAKGLNVPIAQAAEGRTRFMYENATSLPPVVDWRTAGAVTAVKYQGNCGACWAFSAVAAVEGLAAIKTGRLVQLSEEELIDCDHNKSDINGNHGCNGGQMNTAFKFIKKNGGLANETDYPYTSYNGTKPWGTCQTNKANFAFKIGGYEDVPPNNEKALKQAVAHQPVSVGVSGGSFEFQFYNSGIVDSCTNATLDHGVTVVGYGVSEESRRKGHRMIYTETPYWLAKNSWAEDWGEEGFIRIKRNVKAKEGVCMITSMPSYPTAALH